MSNDASESVSLLPSSIERNRNAVLHLCWNNFDLNEEISLGAGTTLILHMVLSRKKWYIMSAEKLQLKLIMLQSMD